MSHKVLNIKTDTRPDLNIDVQVAEVVLTRFIHDEITKVGFKRAVIGLSGSVDSALACSLASAALGSGNVLVLQLLYGTQAPESQAQTQSLIDQLGVISETIDFTPLVKAVAAISPDIDARRLDNIVARFRMTILYDRSTAWDALVVGTSNKTELLLGLGTLFGDLASAINPIGDLYKTQVRQLARAMDLPQTLINDSLADGLIPGMLGGDDLGYTIEEVDRLLHLLFDERYSSDEAESAGFSHKFIKTILEIVRQSHYKRTLPVIPKLSGRTIGHDFRYLRDWGM